MKRKYFILLIFLSIIQTSFAQKDSLVYDQSIEISINDLFINRLLFTYTKSINDRNFLEVVCAYKYSPYEKVNATSSLYIDDAFWYYNNITLRIGVKRYYAKRIYCGISSNFNYQFFDKIRFNHYKDYEGDLSDVDYVISRTKYQFGGLFKAGISSAIKRKIIIDKYIGIGLSYENKEETIHGRYFYTGASPDLNSTSKTSNKIIPTFHFGISIGLRR